MNGGLSLLDCIFGSEDGSGSSLRWVSVGNDGWLRRVEKQLVLERPSLWRGQQTWQMIEPWEPARQHFIFPVFPTMPLDCREAIAIYICWMANQLWITWCHVSFEGVYDRFEVCTIVLVYLYCSMRFGLRDCAFLCTCITMYLLPTSVRTK